MAAPVRGRRGPRRRAGGRGGPGGPRRTPAASAPPAGTSAHAARGALLSVTPLAELTRAEVGAYVGTIGIGSDTVRHGVSAYRLTYATITPQGRPTTATGLLVLPRGGPHRLDLVSDTHGTTVFRGDAPSAEGDFGRITPTCTPPRGGPSPRPTTWAWAGAPARTRTWTPRPG